MSRVVSATLLRLALGGAAFLLVGAGPAETPITFPGAKVVVFSDKDCFDRKAELQTGALKDPVLIGPLNGACVKVRASGQEHFVLPSAIKPPAGCTQARKSASGPQATTYGAQGASSCPGK